MFGVAITDTECLQFGACRAQTGMVRFVLSNARVLNDAGSVTIADAMAIGTIRTTEGKGRWRPMD